MPTYSTTCKTFIESDTQFRDMIGRIRTFLTNIGWVQTSDTGQINPATTTYPGANNTDAGYEMWRMDDSLQSTNPVYLRMTYGRGQANGVFRWTWNISMGGTDGAGVFTGLSTGQFVPPVGITGNPGTRPITDATAYRILGSGDVNRLCVSFFPDVVVAPLGTYWSLERTKDADGSDNGNGLVGYFFSFAGTGGGSGTQEWTSLNYRFAPAITQAWIGINNAGINNWWQVQANNGNARGNTIRSNQESQSGLANGKIWVFPYYPLILGEPYPLMNQFSCWVYDFPLDYSTVEIPIYSADHTYIPLGLGPLTGGSGLHRVNGNASLLMRYE